MTTNLIESTSSAPTLSERAIAEWQRRVDESDVANERQRLTEFKRKVDVCLMYLRDKIGLFDGESIQITATSDVSSGFVATTADGLRFTLKDLHYADSCRDRERLHVSVECSRGCGKELWVNVDSLEDLGGVLQPDATNTHEFGCLQQFDDDGDPITDGMGNPLPPLPPPQPSALERSKLAAAAIEEAAERLAIAIRAVQELEDERPNIKSACIAEMIGTPDPLKPSGVHSASSAKKIVESHARYSAHRQAQASAEVEKHRAYGAYEAAKLRGRLAVEVFIAEERNR